MEVNFWDLLDKIAEEKDFWVTFRSTGRVFVRLIDYEKVSFSVRVEPDRTWKAKLFGVELDPVLSIFCLVPKVLDLRGASDLFDCLNSCQMCPGNPDFEDVCRYSSASAGALFHSESKKIVAREAVSSSGSTVRHVDCQMITSKKVSRCDRCKNVRSILTSLRIEAIELNNIEV